MDALAARIEPRKLTRWINSGALDLHRQLALIAAGLCQVWGAKGVTPKMFSLEPPEPQSPAVMAAQLKAWVVRCGGKL